MKLKGKLAIVTGASTGIGRAISIEFAKEGAKVFLLARTQGRLQETKKLVEDIGGEAEIFVTDLSNASSINKTISEMKGRVTELIFLQMWQGFGMERMKCTLVKILRLLINEL